MRRACWVNPAGSHFTSHHRRLEEHSAVCFDLQDLRMEGLNRPISPCELPTLFENDIVSSVRAHEPSVELNFLAKGLFFCSPQQVMFPTIPRDYVHENNGMALKHIVDVRLHSSTQD